MASRELNPRDTVVVAHGNQMITYVLKTIGEDPEPEEERSYTEPIYETENSEIELIVYDSTIEIPTIEEEVKNEEQTEEETIIEEQPIIEETIIELEIAQEEPVYLDVFAEPTYEEEELPIIFNPIIEEEIIDEYYEEDYYEEEEEVEIDYLIDFDFEEETLPLLEPEGEEELEEDNQMPSGGLRSEIVALAESYVGVTPYVAAGRSLTEGTDCSGFVNLIYDSYGIYASPGSDDYQYEYEHIDYEDLQPGDIVVYRDGGHVGIYAGDDTIIHCSNPEDGTIESDMWYSEPTAYVSLIN